MATRMSTRSLGSVSREVVKTSHNGSPTLSADEGERSVRPIRTIKDIMELLLQDREARARAKEKEKEYREEIKQL